jgi:hypothetical protein
MRQHPETHLYPHSELNYFVEEEVKGRKWRDGKVDPHHWEATHSIDDYSKLFENGKQARAIGHKGADLLAWAPAHERLARFVPNARFIFSLRHPVDRAWSHYCMEIAKGRETLSFDEALAAEDKRVRKSDWARFHLAYRDGGFYGRDLKRFLETFSSDCVLVITLEETIAKPRETLQRVYRFLDVDPELGLDMAKTHQKKNWATFPRPWTRHPGIRQLVAAYESTTGSLARLLTRSGGSRRSFRRVLQRPVRMPAKKVSMSQERREELEALYAPDIALLEDTLNHSFDEWRR